MSEKKVMVHEPDECLTKPEIYQRMTGYIALGAIDIYIFSRYVGISSFAYKVFSNLVESKPIFTKENAFPLLLSTVLMGCVIGIHKLRQNLEEIKFEKLLQQSRKLRNFDLVLDEHEKKNPLVIEKAKWN